MSQLHTPPDSETHSHPEAHSSHGRSAHIPLAVECKVQNPCHIVKSKIKKQEIILLSCSQGESEHLLKHKFIYVQKDIEYQRELACTISEQDLDGAT